MAKNLVIVESPAKAKTIKKYLGKDFEVLASYGHVRDLLPKTGAVDPEHHFAMRYEVIERNRKHVDTISAALKKADNLYLATDPDREGEAIAWHLRELLEKLIAKKPVLRVVFHEITKKAVNAAVANPRDISMELVDAQQARRALDYLVGFNISPQLWTLIRRGLSAGRVQSPALRLIVECEESIEKFQSQEYWTITAQAATRLQEPFQAKLTQYEGDKIAQFTIVDQQQAEAIKQDLLQAAGGKLTVIKVDKKQRKRQPAPPFTTSTLQQEASRKLGYTARRTMQVAQQLYEGINIGGETVGLITYMRTDAVYLAQEALVDIRQLIATRYGKDFLPDAPRVYRAKAKNAQEAHEAIRPTNINLMREQLQNLTPEQLNLYELIWQRTVACQMVHATLDTVSADLKCGDKGIFRANGSVIAHAGFISVYQEGKDDQPTEEGGLLPSLKEGDVVNLLGVLPAQHFTQPPPRYTEATLVKALEEYGIGRPSTYASIISTIQHREYALIEQKRFRPTDVGRIVNKFLTQHFTTYVDYEFTAKLEDQLDAIARGQKKWIAVLQEFWGPFNQQVQAVKENVKRQDVTHEVLDEVCPKCAKPLSIRLGKRGRFIGCTAYPECDYTRNLADTAESASQTADVVADRTCPQCNSPLHIKQGKYGKFIGCGNYPTCKYIEPLEKPQDTKITCPQCYKGTLLKRKSRFGKIFYSCGTYPACHYAVWNEPIAEICAKCHWPIMTIKETKRRGTEKVCPQKTCGFAAPYELEKPAEN